MTRRSKWGYGPIAGPREVHRRIGAKLGVTSQSVFLWFSGRLAMPVTALALILEEWPEIVPRALIEEFANRRDPGLLLQRGDEEMRYEDLDDAIGEVCVVERTLDVSGDDGRVYRLSVMRYLRKRHLGHDYYLNCQQRFQTSTDWSDGNRLVDEQPKAGYGSAGDAERGGLLLLADRIRRNIARESRPD